MERIFGNQLNGVFKEAHQFAIENLDGITEEEVVIMEEVTKGIQTVVELATLPLKMEAEGLRKELIARIKVNHEMDALVGEKLFQIEELKSYARKLEIENRNLLNSCKYLKEVSEKQDLVNDNVVYLNNYRK